ncbi:MAG: cupin-like domain-containing protein [Gammaproteobacteria bacterium]
MPDNGLAESDLVALEHPMSELKLASVDKVSLIAQKDFSASYFKPLRPLVIQDLAKSWPASEKWTPDFFREKHGNKRVKIYDDSFVAAGKHYMSRLKTISMREYIDLVMTSSQDLRMFLYNIKSEIPELVDDIIFPSLIDGLSRNFVFMFFGCKGSVTQMHFDIDMSHVFHTGMYGEKTVYLFPYDQGENLHRYPFTCRSYVDVERPDFQQYPGLKDAQGYKVELEPGETLYIPSGYWHHFVYDEPGYSVSLRCSNRTWPGKLRGYYNLFIMSPIDRLMNMISPQSWFDWKEQQALKTF